MIKNRQKNSRDRNSEPTKNYTESMPLSKYLKKFKQTYKKTPTKKSRALRFSFFYKIVSKFNKTHCINKRNKC